MTKNVLLIEDDLQMLELIRKYLEDFGYRVEAFPRPKAALEHFREDTARYDVVILDLMLPEMDGFDVCREIKHDRSEIPVIISSARGDIGNKIYGYELGVDDYLAKPYEPRELILRIEAVLRRFSRTDILQVGDLAINRSAREVTVDAYTVQLTQVEFDILLYLIEHRDQALSREQLIHAVALPDETKNRTIDTHISNIRYKIGDDPKHPRYIKSVWGMGYRFIG